MKSRKLTQSSLQCSQNIPECEFRAERDRPIPSLICLGQCYRTEVSHRRCYFTLITGRIWRYKYTVGARTRILLFHPLARTKKSPGETSYRMTRGRGWNARKVHASRARAGGERVVPTECSLDATRRETMAKGGEWEGTAGGRERIESRIRFRSGGPRCTLKTGRCSPRRGMQQPEFAGS